MPELSEYEITDDKGVTTNIQLTDDDAKKFPHAKKVGAVHIETTTADEQQAAEQHAHHKHEPVSDRARRSG